ncbi:MAG: endo-1,4-beta-xylanase [Pontiellaceae bacterium]|nr:endo-1,4-beta-xylanase [Pontiellaceae bacterium]
MKINYRIHKLSAAVACSAALLTTVCSAAETDTKEVTLKDAYKKHDIMIGVALNRTVTMQDPNAEADNTDRTMEEVRMDAELAKKQFNQIVNENDLKWSLVQPRPGPDGFDWAPADAFVKFGLDNDMYIVGHTLVWHSQVPNWIFQADPNAVPDANATAQPGQRRRGGPVEPLATREQLLERMREHIHAVVGRYKGKVKVWDVVNEALADGGNDVLRQTYWTRIIGDDFIEKAFEYAHEADPDAILRYNDYGLENPGKREKLKKLVKSLQEKGIPIGAIGTQTHINTSTSFETMDETFRDLATLGLPIHITELDVNASRGGMRNTNADIEGAAARTQGGLVSEADQRLADTYEALFRAILKHKDSVKMVTFWGINDDVSWLGAAKPLLFDAKDQPKQPAFDTVIKVADEDIKAAGNPDPKFYIFLCFGQSNMEGYPGLQDQDKGPVDERLKLLASVDFPEQGRTKKNWYPAVPPLSRPSAGIGPGDYFGRTLVEKLPKDVKVGIVNVSVAGCKIELFQKDSYQEYAKTAPNWMVGQINGYDGNPYQYLVDMAKLAQQDGVIKGILLHQGESNTGDREWPNKVKGVYEDLLADLGLKAEDVPLIAGEVVAADQGGQCAGMNEIIQTLPEVIPTAHVVSAEGCTAQPDHLHFSPAGYRELGKRYAEKIFPLLK